MLTRRMFSVVKQIIQEKLQTFNPTVVQVLDESWMHETNKETHFKIFLVSQAFSGNSSLKRQSLVSKAIQDIWNNDVVTVSIVAQSPEEYEEYKKKEIIYDYQKAD
ncbi:hypothetical protein SteCoe_28991 [Stentor coeruleus]|uniref:Uncharacterized protein n=1 Tax=Stentor coeruleus TaxID=5963 RepID=A0A1R2B728_9CILI|nr:hypothetical protein SteCoe_28991 [Stentor coeruleus]